MTFKDFVAKYNVALSAVYNTAPVLEADATKYDKSALHYVVTLLYGPADAKRTLWVGPYRMGFGYVDRWADKTKFEAKLFSGRYFGVSWTEPDRFAVEQYFKARKARKPFDYAARGVALLRAYVGPKLEPCAEEVLACLQLDVGGCDVAFEDWAADIGYDPDSRKAFAMWNTCNNERRALQRNMPAEMYADFLACEE